jgi:hypothetical protein
VKLKCPLCGDRTDVAQMGHHCKVKMKDSETLDILEQVIDTARIEGMLHILPDDRDNLCRKVRAYEKRKIEALLQDRYLSTKRLEFQLGWVEGHKASIVEVFKVLGIE